MGTTCCCNEIQYVTVLVLKSVNEIIKALMVGNFMCRLWAFHPVCKAPHVYTKHSFPFLSWLEGIVVDLLGYYWGSEHCTWYKSVPAVILQTRVFSLLGNTQLFLCSITEYPGNPTNSMFFSTTVKPKKNQNMYSIHNSQIHATVAASCRSLLHFFKSMLHKYFQILLLCSQVSWNISHHGTLKTESVKGIFSAPIKHPGGSPLCKCYAMNTKPWCSHHSVMAHDSSLYITIRCIFFVCYSPSLGFTGAFTQNGVGPSGHPEGQMLQTTPLFPQQWVICIRWPPWSLIYHG